ncbi:MAG: hypothetical protein RLZZ253_1444, partial [Verrucomicrobiota bacterium]
MSVAGDELRQDRIRLALAGELSEHLPLGTPALVNS